MTIQPSNAIVAHLNNPRHLGFGLGSLKPNLLVLEVQIVLSPVFVGFKPASFAWTNATEKV